MLDVVVMLVSDGGCGGDCDGGDGDGDDVADR